MSSRAPLASRQLFIATVAILMLSWPMGVLASEPKVPPGLDPGGVAIALLGDGVDYTKPELAKRLARDGEGDLIAWDFVDNDIRPYAKAGQSTVDAEYIISASGAVSLVIVKEPAGNNAAAIGHMSTFVVRTPARIVAWPDGRPERVDWPVLFQAAQRFKDRLFIVPGPVRPEDAGKAGDNVIFAAPTQGLNDRAAVLSMAIAAAELLSKQPQLPPADVKRFLIGKP
ncbi:MAG: hypothetical protein AAGD43_28365 [Pseudomonadota bacterium]